MLLWVPGWSYVPFSLYPARSGRAPANPKSSILLSTSLSTFRSNTRFCAAAFPLFLDENMPLSPEVSASLSSR